jgi:hypothetical protein
MNPVGHPQHPPISMLNEISERVACLARLSSLREKPAPLPANGDAAVIDNYPFGDAIPKHCPYDLPTIGDGLGPARERSRPCMPRRGTLCDGTAAALHPPCPRAIEDSEASL